MAPEPILVCVAVAAAPRHVIETMVQLPAGSAVSDALRACEAMPKLAGLDLAAMPCGIWGRPASVDQLLQDGDRVELYRALQVDPKLARRERFAQQGARSTGLFARKRPGAKPGY